MEIWFLIGIIIITAIFSGTLRFFLKAGYRSLTISIIAPVLGLVIYCIAIRDEFGFWAAIFSLGFCACLLGSFFGIFVAALLRKSLSGNPKN